ncbi:hypothetical protein GOBAR_DD05060 [Gossypium barbadense]|nr:hypothetical protein GOBAR_DD05060 [Gossypium barbadense]
MLEVEVVKYEYRWADDVQIKKPIEVSAPKYVEYLMDWIESQLDYESIFPQKLGALFPPNFKEVVKTIFKKLPELSLRNLSVYILYSKSAVYMSQTNGFGFDAVFALAKLMNVSEDESQLFAIARQGLGSACWSLFGGFVKWIMGKEDDGSDSLAVQLVNEKHWEDLFIIIAVGDNFFPTRT